MNVELTDRAQIGLDHLAAAEKKRAIKIINNLQGFPDSPSLRGKYHKIASGFSGQVLYVARLSQRLRAIFRQGAGNTITILEIVHHDRLAMFNMALKEPTHEATR